MLLRTLSSPIVLFNLSEFGISIDRIQKKLQGNYPDYGWDHYLTQQSKIEIIKRYISPIKFESTPINLLLDIYQNKLSDEDLFTVFHELDDKARLEISSSKPTRQRLVSEYILSGRRHEWLVERIESRPFTQEKALVAADNQFDFRKSARTFRELPSELFDDDLLGMLNIVASSIPGCDGRKGKMNVTVHHNLVWCDASQRCTNSPEGVHQDGMDFIVSALCVERKNITGGRSKIFGGDKTTSIFETELQPGQGIFQPDAATDLWHEVTPITAIDKGSIGYRSTIGFDVVLL